MPSTDRAGREQEAPESDAMWREGTGPDPDETPCDVFGALLEVYRQTGQDLVHADWGEGYPSTAARERRELRALHARCAEWLARYEAAAARTAQVGRRPAPAGRVPHP
jgi:hypothetical protein